jgi:hypothetical protein
MSVPREDIERPPGTPCQRCGQRDAVTPEWVGVAWCDPCLREELRQQIHRELTDPERLKLIGSFPHPEVPSLVMEIIEVDRNAVAFVPRIDSDLPPELHYAMTLSRSAELETSCPQCGGATMWKGLSAERPEVYEHRMVLTCYHQADCPADFARVLQAFRRLRGDTLWCPSNVAAWTATVAPRGPATPSTSASVTVPRMRAVVAMPTGATGPPSSRRIGFARARGAVVGASLATGRCRPTS